MTTDFSEEFARALQSLCTDERVRGIEAGASGDALWAEIDALGFTDALVAAEHGGAGLSLAEAGALMTAAGRAGLNHPFAETMVARALLAAAGGEAVPGCIALAPAARATPAGISCSEVPGARLAQHVLLASGGEWLLLPCTSAKQQPGVYRPRSSASLHWASAQGAVFRCKGTSEVLQSLCHIAHAAAMAGAMERVLALAVTYAMDRRQFGRPIGQFQAVQQDLAVLAEQTGSAALAARMGCATALLQPCALVAAAAKLRASEAALRVATLAHATLGAIGITQEHILGTYTARLHEWRASAGTERACARQLGQAVLQSGQTFADFARTSTAGMQTQEAGA